MIIFVECFTFFFLEGLVNIKDKIRDVEGPDMKETMQDQIRQWFIECRLVECDWNVNWGCIFVYLYFARQVIFSNLIQTAQFEKQAVGKSWVYEYTVHSSPINVLVAALGTGY